MSEEPEGGASEPKDADCMRHQPAGKLQFGQDVPWFSDQLNFGFVVPQIADSSFLHLPEIKGTE